MANASSPGSGLGRAVSTYCAWQPPARRPNTLVLHEWTGRNPLKLTHERQSRSRQSSSQEGNKAAAERGTKQQPMLREVLKNFCQRGCSGPVADPGQSRMPGHPRMAWVRDLPRTKRGPPWDLKYGRIRGRLRKEVPPQLCGLIVCYRIPVLPMPIGKFLTKHRPAQHNLRYHGW